MKKYFLLLLLIANSVFANVRVELSQPTAIVDEDFSITFIYQGQVQDLVPDFSELEKDFTILSTAKSSQISVINGQMSSQTQWQVVLNAAHAGQYTIPAIKFGNEHSKPQTLIVKKQSQAQAVSNHDAFFMTAEVDQKQPYVQQQIIYRVKMFYQVQPNSGSFSNPQVDGALLSAMGDSRNYQSTVNGILYNVVEQEYAVFAEKVGQVTIHSPIFKGTVRRNNINDISQIMMDLHKRVRVSAPTVKLKINPIPTSFKGETWLPASNMVLSESWQGLSSKTTAGQPITRIVTLKATGLLASQLPELQFDNAVGAKVYAQPSTSKDNVSNKGIVGEKEFKVVYIPTGKQDVVLPEVKVAWWNTTTNQQQVTLLAQKNFVVSGKIDKANTTQSTKSQNTKPKKKRLVIAQKNSKKPSQSFDFLNQKNLVPWLLVVILVVLLFFITLKKRNITNTAKPTKAKDDKNNISTSRKNLKSACLANDAKAANLALINWAKHKWSDHTIRQTTDIKGYVKNQFFINELALLEQALYSTNHSWQGIKLWQAFVLQEKEKNMQNNANNNSLPEFN